MSIELLVYLSFQMQTIDWTCKKRNRTTRKSVILIAYFLVFVCIYFTTFFSLFLSLHVSCVTQFVIFNSHTIQWQLFLCIVRFVYLYASRTTIHRIASNDAVSQPSSFFIPFVPTKFCLRSLIEIRAIHSVHILLEWFCACVPNVAHNKNNEQQTHTHIHNFLYKQLSTAFWVKAVAKW